jgi:hypothetical protein
MKTRIQEYQTPQARRCGYNEVRKTPDLKKEQAKQDTKKPIVDTAEDLRRSFQVSA